MTTEKQTQPNTAKETFREKLLYGSILGFVGLSATGMGFAGTVTETKKSDNQYYYKHQYNIALNSEATRLAYKALAIGSVYAICGVGLFVYGFWRLTGASNLQEFRAVFAHWIPPMPVKPSITSDMLTWDYAKGEFQRVRDSKQLYYDALAQKKEREAAAKAAKAATEGSSV